MRRKSIMHCDAKGASFMLARSCHHVLPCICQKFEDTVLTHWYLFLGIVGFILFANLALLNLLTAIMVEAVVDILPLFLEESLWNQWRIWICPEHSLWPCHFFLFIAILSGTSARLCEFWGQRKAPWWQFHSVWCHSFACLQWLLDWSREIVQPHAVQARVWSAEPRDGCTREEVERTLPQDGQRLKLRMRNHENMQNQHESSCINFLMAHGSINDFKNIFDALTCMNLYVGRLWPLQLLKKFVFRPRKSMAAREWAAMNSRRM